MKSAWTSVDYLSKKERRDICLLTLDWCVKNMGRSYRGVPNLRVIQSKNGKYFGLYEPSKPHHEIIIYYNVCESIYRLISTTIHEYQHSLQKVRKSYNKLYNEYGYDSHPMEVEARQAEKLWHRCWSDIKVLL